MGDLPAPCGAAVESARRLKRPPNDPSGVLARKI